MNKRGFTLIEIIICISMLVVIGVGSFIGIRMVNKNLTIKELKQITNKAIQASQVYIETNKEAQTQLYTEQNAVKIPLKVLVNEGLLSLKGTNLDENDLKGKYTITALSYENGNCTDIKTAANWDDSTTIYICTNLKLKNTNDSVVEKLVSTSEQYIAKGENPNNWVKFDELYCRIARGFTKDSCETSSEKNYKNKKEGYFRILNIKNNEVEIIFMDKSKITPGLKKSKYTGELYNETTFPTVCGENCDSGREINESIKRAFFYVGNDDCFRKYNDVKRSIVYEGVISYASVGNSTKSSSRMLLYNEYINTFEEGATWLPKSLYLGSATQNGTRHDLVYNFDARDNNSYVYPIFRIVLSDNVTLTEGECAKNEVAGSEECPYQISIPKDNNFCGLEWK